MQCSASYREFCCFRMSAKDSSPNYSELYQTTPNLSHTAENYTNINLTFHLDYLRDSDGRRIFYQLITHSRYMRRCANNTWLRMFVSFWHFQVRAWICMFRQVITTNSKPLLLSRLYKIEEYPSLTHNHLTNGDSQVPRTVCTLHL